MSSHVVTGGAGGVGRAVAERLARSGPVVVARPCPSLGWEHPGVRLVSGDATDPRGRARGRPGRRGGRPPGRVGEQRGRVRRRRPHHRERRPGARARHHEPRAGGRRLPHRREPLHRPRPRRSDRQRLLAPGPAAGPWCPAVRHREGGRRGAHPRRRGRPRPGRHPHQRRGRWARSRPTASRSTATPIPRSTARWRRCIRWGGSGPRSRSPRSSRSCSLPLPGSSTAWCWPSTVAASVNGPDPEAT